MTKDELQSITAKRLEKERRLICQWATGTGKSGVLLKFLKLHPDFNCLVLVPEQNNIENWENEFEKFGVDRSKVSIMCYASFHKQKDTKWDVVCFDEMPHVDTMKRIAICHSVSGDYILALGAVITEDERTSLESVYGRFDKSVISLPMAIKYGYVPSPKVHVLHMDLDDGDRKFWINGRCYTAKGKYEYLQNKVAKAREKYNLSSTAFNKTEMLRAGNERKRFLGEMKEYALRRVCSALKKKNRRFLCFCSSISQAISIGNDQAFTSKTPTSMKLLEKFNNHEIDSLYVVGKLIEGQNLNDIEVGIIGQLGGTDRITVQQCGRILRSQNPVIYIPVFDDTKDESFLYTVTDNVPRECIKHIKF